MKGCVGVWVCEWLAYVQLGHARMHAAPAHRFCGVGGSLCCPAAYVYAAKSLLTLAMPGLLLSTCAEAATRRERLDCVRARGASAGLAATVRWTVLRCMVAEIILAGLRSCRGNVGGLRVQER